MGGGLVLIIQLEYSSDFDARTWYHRTPGHNVSFCCGCYCWNVMSNSERRTSSCGSFMDQFRYYIDFQNFRLIILMISMTKNVSSSRSKFVCTMRIVAVEGSVIVNSRHLNALWLRWSVAVWSYQTDGIL